MSFNARPLEPKGFTSLHSPSEKTELLLWIRCRRTRPIPPKFVAFNDICAATEPLYGLESVASTAVHGADHDHAVTAHVRLAFVLQHRYHLYEAEIVCQQLLHDRLRSHGRNHYAALKP